MIAGIGIDIERISRVTAALDRYAEAFVEKIFTPGETAYCRGKGIPAQHFAARFAAKEAFTKAIGTGWRGRFRWVDVEIANDDQGKPRIVLHNDLAREFARHLLHVSISHTDDYVAAMVVLEHSPISQ